MIGQSADDLGKPGMDNYYGRGRINAYNAVNGAMNAPTIVKRIVRPVGKLVGTWAMLRASQ